MQIFIWFEQILSILHYTIKFYLLCKYFCVNKIYVEKNPYTLYSWVAYKPCQNIDCSKILRVPFPYVKAKKEWVQGLMK